MGCPPSPEEKDMWTAQEKNDEASQLQSKNSIQIGQLKSLFDKLKLEFKNNAALFEKLNSLSINVSSNSQLKPLPQEGNPEQFYSYLIDLRSTANENLSLAKQQEVNLCNYYCFFYNLYKSSLDFEKSKNLFEIKKVIGTYIEHRKEDMNTWRTWLAYQKQSAQSTLDFGEKKQFSKAKKLTSKINIELGRIDKLDEESILLNNTLFARNKEEFDFITNLYS